MIKMISLKPHLYANKRLVAGQEFEARGESDRRLLEALGRAEKAPVAPVFVPMPVAVVPRTYRARAVEAPAPAADPAIEPESVDAPAESVDEAPAVKTTRVYRRRDMKAEG